MKKLGLIFATIFAIVGQSLANRLRGWGGINWGMQIKRTICQIVPVGLLLFVGATWWHVAIAYFISMFGLAVGHGRYFTLGRGEYPPRKDNWPAIIPKLFIKNRYSWSFDAVALAITGVAYTLPFAIVAFVHGLIFAGLAMIVAGVLKVLCYEAAIRIVGVGHDHIRHAELITGAVYGLGFSTILWGLF